MAMRDGRACTAAHVTLAVHLLLGLPVAASSIGLGRLHPRWLANSAVLVSHAGALQQTVTNLGTGSAFEGGSELASDAVET